MAAFFTADTHFGDLHILRRRCWATSVADHDEQLIAGWNDRVGPMDEVWHLGDFAAGASRMCCAEIFERLNGTKRLIRGNHDTNRVLNLPWAEAPVESARAALPGSLRYPLSGRDPQEGDNDDRDNRTYWGRSGPGWAPVAPTQARCGAAPVAGWRSG